MSWYGLVKWLHIAAAVVAVGANLTYRAWVRAAEREPAMLPFVLRRINTLDRRVANPGYMVVLATGLIMAFTLNVPLTTPWLLTALILYVLAALLGILIYAPAARRQRALLQMDGFGSPSYRSTSRQVELLGMVVTADVLIILFLMVVKPPLWG